MSVNSLLEVTILLPEDILEWVQVSASLPLLSSFSGQGRGYIETNYSRLSKAKLDNLQKRIKSSFLPIINPYQ